MKDKIPSEYPQVHALGTRQSLWLQTSAEPSRWDPINADLQTASKLLFTLGKMGEVSEARGSTVTTLLKELSAPSAEQDFRYSVNASSTRTMRRGNMMDHASLLQTCTLPSFLPGA